MRRRRFLFAAGLSWAAPVLAQVPKAGRPYRVGFLTVGSDDGLQQGLRELGYVEGRDIVFEVRDTAGRSDRFDELATELVQRNVDVIVGTFPGVVLAARRATATIPIVMMNTPDPVTLGLVANINKPGGNVTGLTTLTVDVTVKQLELLKEAVPTASRIAVLWNPDNPWHSLAVTALRARGLSLGVAIKALEVRAPDALEGAFRAIATDKAHAVLILADPMLFVHRKRLAELALRDRLPSMGNVLGFAEVGLLLSYWADRSDLARRAASYVDRILRGAKPAELPIEQPTKFDFVVNSRTAKAIGVTLPRSVLTRADRVIE